MVTISTLKDNIYDAFNAIATFEIIWANQDAPRPSSNYITLLLNTFSRVGWDFSNPPDDTPTPGEIGGAAVISGDRELTLSIQAFGSGAFEQLIRLQSKLEMPSIRGAFADDYDLAIVNSSDVTDITGLIDSQMEARASLDIFLRLASPYDTAAESVVTEDQGVIETVLIDKGS